ncbi:hypothetical protein KKC60_02590 [Patescibacteria group bacterium]|nr:hypothetical protein [Patescibacteria group bacterium]
MPFKEQARQDLIKYTETLLGILKNETAPPEAVAIQLSATITKGMIYCGDRLFEYMGMLVRGALYRDAGFCASCEGDEPNELELGHKTCSTCEDKKDQ